MSASKKLSLAVKALCVLEHHKESPLSSAQIAEELEVNPSKLRRILSILVKNKLIVSTQGTAGGFVLNKPADQINLQEIYCSVEEKKAFYLDVHSHLNKNSFSSKMNEFLLDLFSDVQVVIEEKMRQITVDELTKKTEIL
jgi:Rrf2 family protein